MKAHTEMSEIKEAKEDYVSEDRIHKHIPDRQRALVLQGGGALGAYEVGVLKVLCKNLAKKQGKDGKDEPLFDIIAGKSMGAMNAAVLVSNVINRRKTWEEAVEQLEIFWTDEKKVYHPHLNGGGITKIIKLIVDKLRWVWMRL